MGPGGRTNHRH